jgi:5'-nucleotidase
VIFLTNDDGVHAPGLLALAAVLEEFDSVYAAAPDRERSSSGMAITLHRPLRARAVAPNRIAVDGTPVDCVDLAVGKLLPERPVLLVAGINEGENLGHDVHFSGTVAAARKGTFLGVPSVAVSLARGAPLHLETAGEIARRVVKAVLMRGLPPGVLLNVNVPNMPLSEVRGIRLTRLDPAPYDAHVDTRLDKAGVPYYWIGGRRLDVADRSDTDYGVVREGYVSLTPMHADMTDYDALAALREWRLSP